MTHHETRVPTNFPYLPDSAIWDMSPSPWPAASKELRQFPGDQRLPRAGGAMQQHAPHVADAQVPDHGWREDPGRKGAPEDVAKLPWWILVAWYGMVAKGVDPRHQKSPR